MSLQTVRLYGRMGALFGRVHRIELSTRTPAEAIQALMSQFPAIRSYLLNAKNEGRSFAVFTGKRNINRARMDFPTDEDIRIAPIIMGSKKAGVLQTIVGVVLVVVGVLTSEFGGGFLIPIGAAMIAGGVVQMLTPMPKNKSSADSAGNQASDVFNGPINTQAQGNPVPLLYGGPMIVGSAVISAGITTEESSYSPGLIPGGNGYMGGLFGINHIEIR